MKPFWSAATPPWAKFLAQDEQGRWWWFAEQPKAGLHNWQVKSGRYELATGNPNWTETLEARP